MAQCEGLDRKEVKDVMGSLEKMKKTEKVGYQKVKAKDYSNTGCVDWVKDRASAKLGITLPKIEINKYGYYGANNYWYILNYSKGSEPRANSLAIWEFNNGSDGCGGKCGHVAFVESVDGDNVTVTVTEGGCKGYSYARNTGVICRTKNKSQMRYDNQRKNCQKKLFIL